MWLKRYKRLAKDSLRIVLINLMPEPTPLTIKGYHGCDADNQAGIVDENFRLSQGQKHFDWLGEGAYFFGHCGFSDPVSDARKWANAESWDNKAYKRKYLQYVVLSAKITAHRYLDMNSDDGKKVTKGVRETLLGALRQYPTKDFYNDSKLIKHLTTKVKFDLVICDLYIQFANERKAQILSRFPNARVICVYTPSAIDKSSIVLEDKGKISSTP